ncbi:MAG: nitronate monooxygenase [Frankiaceae bacterium]|nr:nitronate monooxygenase [Frankiaceae bacterium]
MIRTWLTNTFGLTVPVVSAPMAGVSGGALAAAVSAAGGLGMVGFAAGTGEQLRAELDIAGASGKPYGVGLLAWLLAKNDEPLDAAIESDAALVSVSYGPYAPYVERAQAAGKLVATQVGTLDDARAALAIGVDVIVVRGGEGGGHGRNEVATLPLLQAVLDAADVPVLAAGGIATGRGLAAVLAAGAAGAWVGTAFTVATEAATPDAGKQAVAAAGLADTTYTTVLDIGRGADWPAEFGGRALRHPYADKWHGREDELRANPEPMEEPVTWAGQAAGLVARPRPAADIVAELATAERYLGEVANRTDG